MLSPDFVKWHQRAVLRKGSRTRIARGVPIAKRRVQQAGIRIADLLESAFAPGPLVPDEVRRRR